MKKTNAIRTGAGVLVLALAAGLCAAQEATPSSPASPATPAATPALKLAEPKKPVDPRGDSSTARSERAARLQKAVEQLMAEARELDDFKLVKSQAVFTRPHPLLSTWGSEMSMDVLQRMMQPFTGDKFRDTYIRWHLLAIVKKATQADRRQMGPRLLDLIQKMPDGLTAQGRPDHHYEPEDKAQKYYSLIYSGDITVGYPPFQRRIGPPESYKYMDAAKAAQVQANLEEASRLRDKFHVIYDPAAQAWNQRITSINYYIREYRGELIYELLLTGDPNTAKVVMNEVDRLVKAKSGVAFDLLAYVYLAAFDKALALYDQKTLDEMSETLEATCRGADEYVPYSGQTRNFAQYAFHLVYMLKDGGGFFEVKEDDTPSRYRH